MHLDTAGRNIHAALRDRELADADAALVELTALGRIARQSPQEGRLGPRV